jgi:CDP-diacylglycerol--serine O-phosphatidyltransferase
LSKLKKPRRILKPVPVTKLIPNLVTLVGLVVGISSIRFALDSKWEMSIYCVLIAAIIDGLDGKIARMLNATSHFGAELDSLCDFVNFGVCPAFITYLWSFQQYEYKVVSWASITFFIVCMCIRLARFNTMILNPIESKQAMVFSTGVPAPSGAILMLIPMILDFEITTSAYFEDFSIRGHTLLINIYIIFIAILLASKLPTISIKDLNIKPEYISLCMVVFAIIIIVTVIYPWYMLPIFAIIYFFSIIVCIYISKKL